MIPTDEIYLVDTHAHLVDERLAPRIEELLDRAAERGVQRMIAIGTTAADSAAVVALAESYEQVFAAVGIQPNYVAESSAGDFEKIEALATHPRVVAIGETGLDRYWDHTPFAQQQEFFGLHLDLAERVDKPVVIHCRECEQDIVAQLEKRSLPVRGVLHSFTGNWEHARAFLSLGLCLSFAGMITFPSKKLDELRRAATLMPLDRMLVETDSPYLAPQSVRGKTNEPGNVAETAAFIAQLRGISVGELSRATSENAGRLFGFGQS